MSVLSLESLEKPLNLLELIQGLKILEFYKVVLRSLECYCGQLKIIFDQTVVMSDSRS